MKLLIACLGNLLRGDDGFGVRVAQRLAKCDLPDAVVLREFGIRGLDFSYALLDAYESVIVVDASPRGQTPGTVSVIEPTLEGLPASVEIETHGMQPVQALLWARAMGSPVRRIRLVACEPAELGSEERPVMELSAAVQASIDPAVELVLQLARDWEKELARCTSWA